MNSPYASTYNILALIQNYSIAETICHLIKASSLFLNGVNRFNTLLQIQSVFHSFTQVFLLDSIIWFITKNKNINAKSPFLVVVAFTEYLYVC